MSTQSAHTPGPWELQPNGACYNLRSPDRVDHFMILVGMEHNNPGELDANARIVTSALDMHDALSRLVARADSDDPDDHYSDSFGPDFDYARRVLTETKGGAS